jgi:hypothetical protein
MAQITENDWNTLVTKIRSGLCTPFIGAGASHPTLPLGGDLSTRLLADEERATGSTCPLPDRTDLARVTQFIAVTRNDTSVPKLQIANIIKAAAAPADQAADPHKTLAALGLPIYLTTNYDDFMVRALRQRLGADADIKRELARWTEDLRNETASAFDVGYTPTPTSPVVFHLHGHADQPLSIVATEDDYLDFLVSISKDLAGTQPAPTLRTILPLPIRRAIKTTTLLFVGYGLNDLNFRVILRGLVSSLQPSGRQIHIAVQFAGGSGAALRDYLERYYEWSLQVNILWGTASDFCAELEERMRRGQ